MILIAYNEVQPIEILWVVNNLFETMIRVNLKGRLMNFNEVQDGKQYYFSSYHCILYIKVQQQMDERSSKYCYFLFHFW